VRNDVFGDGTRGELDVEELERREMDDGTVKDCVLDSIRVLLGNEADFGL
jgi:hypothetical protein